jgi:hypothetical protein
MAGRHTKRQTTAFVPTSIDPSLVISENFPERWIVLKRNASPKC